MPPLETACRFQDAVVQLAGTGVTDFDDDGATQVAAAIGIKVRWEDVKREVLDAHGNNVSIDASVVVDREILPGSVMWLGVLGSYVATVTKYRVVQYNETPDLKGRNKRRTVALMKLGDTAPSSI